MALLCLLCGSDYREIQGTLAADGGGYLGPEYHWELMKFLRVQGKVGTRKLCFGLLHPFYRCGNWGAERVTGFPRTCPWPKSWPFQIRGSSLVWLHQAAPMALKPSGLLSHLEIPQYKSFMGVLMVTVSPKDVEPPMRSQVTEMCDCGCLFTL